MQIRLLETQLVTNAVPIVVYLLKVCADHMVSHHQRFAKKDNWPYVTTCPQVSVEGEQIINDRNSRIGHISVGGVLYANNQG